MNLSVRVLGKTIVAHLSDRLTKPVLRIGSDRFGLQDLAAVDCFNFLAARNLDRILNAELQVKSTKDLFDNVAPYALALPQLGAISFAVLGAAFEAKGLGGDRPLEAWVTRHHDDEHSRREFITIATLKQHQRRDREAAHKERRAKKRRASTRRDQAHRQRVERFTERQTGSSES